MGLKILYVANIGPHDNRDEESLVNSFNLLGHQVYTIPERHAYAEKVKNGKGYDLCLFHKWDDYRSIEAIRCPKIFWFFDLVQSPDWDLRGRERERIAWMEKVIPLVDLGFCTDGDWVHKVNTDWQLAEFKEPPAWMSKVMAHPEGPLVWLMQGADERVMGRGKVSTGGPTVDLLFTGSTIHGGRRKTFVDEMEAVYGSRFVHLGQKLRARVHGRELADIIAGAKVVLAPDGPTSDRYWSNRVYQTLGFGGFLLHPACKGLEKYYTDGVDLVYYHDRVDLHNKIQHYLSSPQERLAISENGLRRTRSQNTYTHRVAEMLSIVKERLG